MTRGRTAAMAAVCGAWTASCSAGVDGYHLATETVTSDGGASHAPNTGATSSSGAVNAGGFAGSRATGGAGGTHGDTDASAGGGTESSGGRGTALGGSDGGPPEAGGNGGNNESGGARGTGGAPGTGGLRGSGGAGSGGAPGSGGAGAGGASGMGGASGTGGAPGTGDPVLVQPDNPLSGITAAAWKSDLSPPRFFLLEATNHRFWTLTPTTATTATRGGPFSLPSGSVASHAFGVSASYVYVVIDGAINRVPIGGSTTATTVVSLVDSFPTDTTTGAYAKGWFLVAAPAGKTRALADPSATTLDPAIAIGQVHRIVTDGTSFAFRTVSGLSTVEHLIAAGSPFSGTATPCVVGSSAAYLEAPSGISGNTAAWVTHGGSGAYKLSFATVSGGVCGTATSTVFGTVPNGKDFVGLIDNQSALVVPNVSATFADVQIRKASSGVGSAILTSVDMGMYPPYMFVVGSSHYAVLLSDDKPALISF